MNIIPDLVRSQIIRSLPSTASAWAAASMMAEYAISAVLVVDDGALVGIVTERDIARAFADRLDPDAVRLAEVMTPSPEVVAPDDDARDALELMKAMHIRHLPVVAGDAVVGVISVRDLMSALNRRLENAARNAQRYLHGDRYHVE